MTFRAPVRDLAFALSAVGHDALIARAYPDLDADTVGAVLEAAGAFANDILAPLNSGGGPVGAVLAPAGAFANDILAPLNRGGDTVGARYENGAVFAAPGFAEAYKAFV